MKSNAAFMYSGFNRQRELRGYSCKSQEHQCENGDLVVGIGTASASGSCGGAVAMDKSGNVMY